MQPVRHIAAYYYSKYLEHATITGNPVIANRYYLKYIQYADISYR